MIKDRKLICKNNGQKGGRPKQDSKIRIELPEVDMVILTPTQYGSLLEKYGYKLLSNAVLILDKWLKSGSKEAEKYAGKNNYAHFRSDGWVINTARNTIKQQSGNEQYHRPEQYNLFLRVS